MTVLLVEKNTDSPVCLCTINKYFLANFQRITWLKTILSFSQFLGFSYEFVLFFVVFFVLGWGGEGRGNSLYLNECCYLI